MKKLLTLILIAASISAQSDTSKCDNLSIEGSYESKFTLGDVPFVKDINFAEILPSFNMSVVLYSLKKNEDTTYSFKFDGLTPTGDAIVAMEGEAARESMMLDFAELEKSILQIKEVNDYCALVMTRDDSIMSFIDDKTGILFSVSEDEGEVFIGEISQKILDVVIDEDPFDF